jgi:hypothetical protein
MTRSWIVKLFLCALALAPVAGLADEVKFATSTTMGCFSGTQCTPSSATSSTTDLTFQGSSFGQPSGISTVNGSLDLGLGSFTLTDHQTAFINTNFDSVITFTLPVYIAGGQSTTFDAHVIGIVGRNLAGAVYINFDNTPQHFTFSNGTSSGSFDFSVSDILFGVLGMNGQSTVAWNGEVTNATISGGRSTVPEPGSLALILSSGLLPVAWRRLRRN